MDIHSLMIHIQLIMIKANELQWEWQCIDINNENKCNYLFDLSLLSTDYSKSRRLAAP